MKLFVIATICIVYSQAAYAGTFAPVPGTQAAVGTTYIASGTAFHFVDPQFGVDEILVPSNRYISVDQFASTDDLNTAIAKINTTVSGFSSQVSGFSGQVAALSGLGSALSDIKHQALTGAALAAALTPILPWMERPTTSTLPPQMRSAFRPFP